MTDQSNQPSAPRQKSVSKTSGDWRQRLHAAQERVEQTLLGTRQDPKGILRRRAEALAQIAQPGRDWADLEVLEFALAREKYAVGLEYLYEVSPMKEFSLLPCAPSHFAGIVNVRGRVLPVLDLRKFFELPEKGITNLNQLVIVGHETREAGILADSIACVRSVAKEKILDSLPTLTGRRAEYLRGVADDQLIILNVEAILSDPRLKVNDEAGI